MKLYYCFDCGAVRLLRDDVEPGSCNVVLRKREGHEVFNVSCGGVLCEVEPGDIKL